MRINAVFEPLKYDEHRKFRAKSEQNTKQNNNNEKVSFMEILKKAKGDLYLQNNGSTVNKVVKYQR